MTEQHPEDYDPLRPLTPADVAEEVEDDALPDEEALERTDPPDLP